MNSLNIALILKQILHANTRTSGIFRILNDEHFRLQSNICCFKLWENNGNVHSISDLKFASEDFRSTEIGGNFYLVVY